MQKIALITGITGQDGSYLAEFLLGSRSGAQTQYFQYSTYRPHSQFRV